MFPGASVPLRGAGQSTYGKRRRVIELAVMVARFVMGTARTCAVVGAWAFNALIWLQSW